MGLAFSLRLWSRISKKQPKQKQQSPLLFWMKETVLTMTLTLTFGQLAAHARGIVSNNFLDDLKLFYIANYALNAALVFSISVIAPYITNIILHSKEADK